MDNQELNNTGESRRDSERPRPRFSPFSPFPYGSPLTKFNPMQTSFSGSPGQKMLLGQSLNQTGAEREVMTPRLKGQDLYGGPVMFGSSARKSRLISASPYSAAFRTRAADKQARLERMNFPTALGTVAPVVPPSSLPSTAPSSPHSSPSQSSSPPAPLSSTARVILSTLEKISSGGTPVTDARKIPMTSPSSASRAEKRKLIESELNCSLSSSSPGRRRARLGGGGLALALAGPPLRKNFSPSLNSSNSSASNSSMSSASKTTPLSRKSQVNSQAAETDSVKVVPEKSSTRTSLVTEMSNNASATSNTAKSSFKMKSKVTDSGRSRPDLTAPISEVPDPLSLSTVPQLQVNKLPVFNFTSTPAPIKTKDSSKIDVKKPDPPVSPIPPEVLERNNNDKSPLKRGLNDDSTESPSKIKCVEKSPLDTDTVKKSKEKPSLISSDVSPSKSPKLSKTFSFSAPKSVIKNSSEEVSEATKKYSFCLPKSASSLGAGLSNGPSTSENKLTCAPVSMNFMTSNVSSKVDIKSVKTMPDITNNTLSKSLINDKIKGSSSNSGLPDVTANASTGFGFLPAKELKSGSVMDILGLQKSGF